MRVSISRKEKAPLASTRNSIVPTLVYPTARLIMRQCGARRIGTALHRDACVHRHLPRAGLTAHRRHGLGRWADEDESGATARLGKLRVLREEPVPAMHRVGAG